MTTFMFECNNEAENSELLRKIWEAIKDWKEFAEKEVTLCKTINEQNGKHYVYLTIEDGVGASVSLCFNTSDSTPKYFELKLEKGEAHNIQVPADVKASIRETVL